MIYLLEIKTFYFESLLNFIPNRPEPIGDGETAKYPAHTQRMRQIADYIIGKHSANFQSYAAETRTFDKRQLSIAQASNWDYRKCKTLDLTKTEHGFKVRDGRHRSIILSVLVLTGQIAYQPIRGEISDFQNKVEASCFRAFFENYVTYFEKDNDYRANLRIHFEDDQDLSQTMQRYKAMTIEMLRDVSDQTKAQMMPLKIVGICGKGSQHYQRIDITGKELTVASNQYATLPVPS